MNLVYQYYLPYPGEIGKPDWVEIGKKSAEKYSKEIGAEYIYSEEKYMNSVLNVFESFRLFFDESFDCYDKILLLDIDTIVNTKDNIFDIEIEDVGMVHELGVYNRSAVPGASFTPKFWDNYFNNPHTGISSYAKKFLDEKFKWKKSKLHPNEKFALYNGGVQVWSKEGRIKARSLFDSKKHDHFHKETGKGETAYLNMMLFHHGFKITELENDWNRLNFQWSENNHFGKITHFNDIKKDKMYNHGK